MNEQLIDEASYAGFTAKIFSTRAGEFLVIYSDGNGTELSRDTYEGISDCRIKEGEIDAKLKCLWGKSRNFE
jgi:hypothetical protein